MTESLCWRCRRSTKDYCQKVANGTPIEGWTARQENGAWHVIDCPQHIKDDARTVVDIAPGIERTMSMDDWTQEHCLYCPSLWLCETGMPICKERRRAKEAQA